MTVNTAEEVLEMFRSYQGIDAKKFYLLEEEFSLDGMAHSNLVSIAPTVEGVSALLKSYRLSRLPEPGTFPIFVKISGNSLN